VALGCAFIFYPARIQKPSLKSTIFVMLGFIIGIIFKKFIPEDFMQSPYRLYLLLTIISVFISFSLVFFISLLSEQLKIGLKKVFPIVQATVTTAIIFLGVFLVVQTWIPIERIKTVMTVSLFVVFVTFVVLGIMAHVKVRREQ
jgi:hypothetical protein